MRKKKLFKKLLPVLAIATVMAIGGIAAYFTASDSVINTWTVGSVEIDLMEEAYDAATDERFNISPNKLLTKDPKVKNTGNSDAYVFLRLTVPKADVCVASQNGLRTDQCVQELFEYTINPSWVLINEEIGIDENTYVFAYGTAEACRVLAPEAVTATLFEGDQIRFKNVIEGQGLERESLEMPVDAFAIQTTDLGDGTVTSPAAVWAILENQIASI